MILGLYGTVSPNKGMGILRKKPLKSGTEEHLIGRLESRTLPRSVVKFVHSSVRIFLRQLREVHSLGEVLAYKSVCVLTKPPLPRVVRTGEVPVRTKLAGDLFMRREFLAVIARHRLEVVVHGHSRLEYGPGDGTGFFVL